jgi:hypothetical protein
VGLCKTREIRRSGTSTEWGHRGQAAGGGVGRGGDSQIAGLRASSFKKKTQSYCSMRITSRRENGSNLTDHGNLRSDFYTSLTAEFGMIYLFPEKSPVLWNLHKCCRCESDRIG